MGSAEKPSGVGSADLLQSAIRYFKKEGYSIERDETAFEGFTGVSWKFDLVVQKGHVQQGVWVKDWNRTIGVNLVINIDKASEDVGLASPIIIGDKFSDHAKSYANRRKITLLPKQKMLLSLR
jgi:galactitol-specific phosphotransferase system IIB component